LGSRPPPRGEGGGADQHRHQRDAAEVRILADDGGERGVQQFLYAGRAAEAAQYAAPIATGIRTRL
jgi:hypothetical protein